MNLQGRDFLTLKDFTPEEISYLLDLSAELKRSARLWNSGGCAARKKCGADF